MHDAYGPLDLLVVQPTPFCNLDCSYCYLPDRGSRRRMSLGVLEQAFEWVAASGLARRPYTVVWHAGEPLVVPRDWYAPAFALAARFAERTAPVTHAFQSNATLIDDAWCAFFREHGVRVGVSVDGPAFLHDARRRTRAGRGTHARVMAGIACLQRNEVPFHVITVLTREHLDYPDELHAFYLEHGIDRVGFNVEEIEGPNATSSLSASDTEARYRAFLSRFFDLAAGGEAPLHVREISSAVAAVLHADEPRPGASQEATPFAIVSVSCDGSFGTWSPELLGMEHARYGNLALGHVARDPFERVVETPHFRALHRDVASGVARCRERCPYFHFCGGGAPANKLYENGSFDSTETLFCRLHRQALAEVVLAKAPRRRRGTAHAVA